MKETFIGLTRAVEIQTVTRAEVNDAGEVLTPILIFPYGYSHNPPVGSRVVGQAIDGDRGNSYGTAYHPISQVKTLNPGDVALNTAFDSANDVVGTQRILLNGADGSIVIVAGTGRITLGQTGKITITGRDITVDGDLKVTGRVDAEGTIQSETEVTVPVADAFVHLSTHTHTVSGPNTSPPTRSAV